MPDMLHVTFAPVLLAAGAGFLLLLPLVRARKAVSALPEVSLSDTPDSGILPAGAQSGQQPDPQKHYLLRLRENTLYVYEAGSRDPEAVYEVQAGLPDYDRILLEYGMEVRSEAELRGVLEDYVS